MDQRPIAPTFTVTSSAAELRAAARSGDLDEAKQILNRYDPQQNALHKLLPAVLTAVDAASGNSALHLCCANGHLELVKLLLQVHNNVNQKNASGSTPLHYACITGQLEVVRVLLQNGALPVVENQYGKTALDEAYNGSHQHVVNFLIEHVQAHVKTPHATAQQQSQQEEQQPS